MNRTALRRLFGLLASISIVAAACGTSQGPITSKTPKDTLVIGAPALPVTLDGESAGTFESWEALAQFTEKPVDFQITTDSSGIKEVDASKPPVGLLADSYTRSSDGLKYTITLKKGVKSYFGNELTSQDVKWTFDRGIALSGSCTFEISVTSIDKANPVTIHDAYTLDINLTAPNPLLPLWWAIQPFTCAIYDSTEVKKHATSDDPWAKTWLATHSAGFGPYQVAKFISGQEVDWVANPNYHGGAPALKNVIYKLVPEPATRAALLQRGDIDVALGLGPQELANLKGKPGVQIDNVVGNLAEIFALNNNVKPFDDVRVRQAIAYALPVQDIIKTVYLNQPGVQVAPGYLPATYPGALSQWPYQQDLTKAKQLLSQAGVGAFSFDLVYNSARPSEEQMAILIKSALQPLGITVVLDKLAPAKYQEQYFTKKAQAVLVNDSSSIPDGPYSLYLYFDPKGTADWINYNNPAVNALLEQAIASADPAARASLSQQAHQLIVADAPWGFYLHVGYHLARRDYVHGFVWQTTEFLRFFYLSKS